MLDLTEAERAYFSEMSSLGVDGGGAEVLVGLTREESLFYLAYSRGEAGVKSDESRSRYLDLHEKHQATRLQIVFAEVELRDDAPQKH
jgi:hypothetical protein